MDFVIFDSKYCVVIILNYIKTELSKNYHHCDYLGR